MNPSLYHNLYPNLGYMGYIVFLYPILGYILFMLIFPMIRADVELYIISNATRFPKDHTPQVRPDFVSTVNLCFLFYFIETNNYDKIYNYIFASVTSIRSLSLM